MCIRDRIKTAEKTASDAAGQQNTPQNEQFANQMMLQLLPKLDVYKRQYIVSM